MKKVIALLMVLLPFLASAQSFVLTPDGFKNSEDESKNFIVVPMEGTQTELYNRAKTAVTIMWNSPKDVMSYNEPEIIVVNGFSSGDLFIKTIGITNYFDFNYRLQIQFKEGRIRIDAPSVDKATIPGKDYELYFCGGKGGSMGKVNYVFDQNGKLKQGKIKEQAEKYFNALVGTLIDKMKNGASSEDW